jgi:hypothetical protein
VIAAMHDLRVFPPTFAPRVRAAAASDALLGPSGAARGNDPFKVGHGSAVLESAYSRAATLLETDLPDRPQPAEPAEKALSEVDDLVGAMLDVAANETVEGLAGALALLAGTALTLSAGVRLGHEDPEKQQRMAAALGVLDPLALADRPESRAAAARALRELARSASPTAGASSPTT